MNRSITSILASAMFAGLIAALPSVAHADNYPGNGASGFGSPVGSGSLTVTDTANSLTVTLNRGSGSMNDALVVYLDTKPGGINDTSSLTDNGDGGRTAISGANNGNPSRSLVTFVPAFGADYAMAIENGFIGVFDLSNPANFNFVAGAGQSGNNNAASYSLTLNAAEMALIGLTAGSGQTFYFEGSLVSTSAYRSNETIGASITVPADGAGNAGFNNPQTFTSDSAFTLSTVPEPTSLGLLGLGTLGLLGRRRK